MPDATEDTKPEVKVRRSPQHRTKKEHDPKADPLRVALKEIKGVLSASHNNLLRLIGKTGHDPKISLSWFEQYLAYSGTGQGKSLDWEPRQQLEAFAFRSPLGRALRALKTNTAPDFDKLMGVLASGNFTRPPETQVAGRYFMYHGSYVKAERYVVRALEIACIDDSPLTVKDGVKDNITMQGAPRYAHGVVTFVHARPQILLHAKANKAGLCLFIGGETIYDGEDRAMVRVTGSFIAQRTTNNHLIYRRALLLREPDATPEAMLEETGIFTRTELEEDRRARHFAAFQLLAKHLPDEGFEDPILSFLPPSTP
jgi:hypothetical protein